MTDAVPVDPKDVPFDLEPPLDGASPFEIEVASMIAHGATSEQVARALRVKLERIRSVRQKPTVKRLVDRYRRAPVAGFDILNVGATRAAMRLLKLVDDGDKRIAATASIAILKLAVDLQKLPPSQIQVNVLAGVTVQARAAGKTDEELFAEAELSLRVLDRVLRRRKEADDD